MMIDLGIVDAGVARATREVSGKSTYDAVLAHDAGPIHAPHRAGLLRWIHELVQRRLGKDLAEEEAEREKAEDPALADARGPIEIAKTWEEAHAALFTAPSVIPLEKAFARLGALADPIAAVRRERRIRRFEVSKRLGLDHPWALAIDGGSTTVEDLARTVLDATEPLAQDLHKRIGGSAAHTVEDAFAREAREGWPARLTKRWLEDAFRVVAPRTPKDVTLPPAIGGSSFLRAALDWGHAVRIGSTARSLPYALARDPAPTEAFLHGALLALAVESRVFGTRKLGLSTRVADSQARLLARASLFTLRQLAAIACLGRGESAADDEIEHLSARVFGRPLPRSLGTAWANGGFSGRMRDDIPARLAGAVRAYTLAADLVRHYDEDWFENPRAASRIAQLASGPVWQGDKPEGFPAIARAFEEDLG